MMRKLQVAMPLVYDLAGYSILQTIILTNKFGFNWFYENYTELCCSLRIEDGIARLEANFTNLPTLRQYNEYDFSPQQIFCPLINTYQFDPEYVINSTNIISFIKYYINKGFYIAIYLDRKFIPQMKWNSSYPHVSLIYGYDDKNQFVNITEYIEKYTFFELSYQDLEKAFSSAISIGNAPNISFNVDGEPFSNFHKIVVISHKNDSYEFEIIRLKNRLKFYLQSDPPNIFGNLLYAKFFNDKWGIDSYDAYIDFIAYYEENVPETNLDLRQFHILYEHKHSLYLKVCYLNQIGYPVKHLQDEFLQLSNQALVIRNMLLKYNLTRKSSLLKGIKSKLQGLKIQESKILKILLEML